MGFLFSDSGTPGVDLRFVDKASDLNIEQLSTPLVRVWPRRTKHVAPLVKMMSRNSASVEESASGVQESPTLQLLRGMSVCLGTVRTLLSFLPRTSTSRLVSHRVS